MDIPDRYNSDKPKNIKNGPRSSNFWSSYLHQTLKNGKSKIGKMEIFFS